MDELAENINQGLLTDVNKVLDSSKPGSLILIMETFVALLRNREKANHVDVKLYMEDLTKLMYKLKNIEINSLSPEIVAKHIETLQPIGEEFEQLKEKHEWNRFEVFVTWSHNFAHYANDFLNQKKVNSAIKEKQDEIVMLKAQQSMYDDVLDIYNNDDLQDCVKNQEGRK